MKNFILLHMLVMSETASVDKSPTGHSRLRTVKPNCLSQKKKLTQNTVVVYALSRQDNFQLNILLKQCFTISSSPQTSCVGALIFGAQSLIKLWLSGWAIILNTEIQTYRHWNTDIQTLKYRHTDTEIQTYRHWNTDIQTLKYKHTDTEIQTYRHWNTDIQTLKYKHSDTEIQTYRHWNTNIQTLWKACK